MKRIFTYTAMAALIGASFVVTAISAFAQQKSLKDQLVGTWTLTSWEQVRADGSKLKRFGENPKGVAQFDAGGRFFLMLARPDLPKIASNSPTNPTPEEAKALVGGSLAYYGTYTVSEADKTIILRIESSTFPNQVGNEQKRIIGSLTADELKYSNPVATSGGQIVTTFKRTK